MKMGSPNFKDRIKLFSLFLKSLLKPFQGWRYLAPEAAPPDLDRNAPAAQGLEALPQKLRAELRALGLI